MTFISYAQNYEDVMLRRALKDVDKGFYIDVGANDPVTDSVTKAFYDAGWRGINIEPVSEWYEKIQQDRPDDINLQTAVGARKGSLKFYEVVGTGLSTMDESIAKRHMQERGYEIKSYKVPVVRLTTICERLPRADIHFLKIDVEGAELSVLQGLDLKKIRPWIILVEATLPNTQIENHAEWESSLVERGYHYIYSDGLNRYYIADEHIELDTAFLMPPNIFDDFKRASEYWLECHCHSLQSGWDTAKIRIEELATESITTKTNEAHLSRQLSEKTDVLISNQAALTKQQDHTQWLQKEWDITKVRIEKLAAELAATKINHTHLEKQLVQDIQSMEQRIEAANREMAELKTEHRTELDRERLRAEQLNIELNTMKEQYEHLNLNAQSIQNQKNAAMDKIYELECKTHHRWLEAERLSYELGSVYKSKSWRITWPLRLIGRMLRWCLFLPVRFARIVKRLVKKILRPILLMTMRPILRQPGLKRVISSILRRFPSLHNRLQIVAANARSRSQNTNSNRFPNQSSVPSDSASEHHITKESEELKSENNIELYISRIYSELEMRDNKEEPLSQRSKK